MPEAVNHDDCPFPWIKPGFKKFRGYSGSVALTTNTADLNSIPGVSNDDGVKELMESSPPASTYVLGPTFHMAQIN